MKTFYIGKKTLKECALFYADCIGPDGMRKLTNKSVDMVMADPPYELTACKWDSIIPLKSMWEELKRVIKPNGAIVLMASQPFTTKLISSNMEMFKYCWYWKKSKPNGWQHSKNRPMTAIEECCVFSFASMGHVSQLSKNRMVYNPQNVISSGKKIVTAVAHGQTMGARPNQIGIEYESYTGFPHNVLEYANITGSDAIHPTQKPVALMEYLIKTYTNEGETVLDFAMGSGTTGEACLNLNRKFIGYENDLKYFNIAKRHLFRWDKYLKWEKTNENIQK